MFIIILPQIFYKNFRGLAIYPFIFLKSKDLAQNKEILNHERIHLRQQLEMLWFFFFIWYGIEFFIHLIRYKDSKKAYFNISFEREAYQNESNTNYLKTRKFFAFYSYL